MSSFYKKENILTVPFYDFTIYPLLSADAVLEAAMGKNERELLIVFDEPSEAELPLLEKILAAIHYTMEEDTFLYKNTAKNHWKFIDVQKKIHLRHFISFGVPPKMVGIQRSVRLYVPFEIGDTVCIFAHPLTTIAQNKNHKSELWNVLKDVFLKNSQL